MFSGCSHLSLRFSRAAIFKHARFLQDLFVHYFVRFEFVFHDFQSFLLHSTLPLYLFLQKLSAATFKTSSILFLFGFVMFLSHSEQLEVSFLRKNLSLLLVHSFFLSSMPKKSFPTIVKLLLEHRRRRECFLMHHLEKNWNTAKCYIIKIAYQALIIDLIYHKEKKT